MEVAEGIDRIDTMLGARTSSIYVIKGRRACLLFDVGVDGDASGVVGPYLDQHGIDRGLVTWTMISHCDVDHFGGLADARVTFPQSRCLAHVLDRAAITSFATYLQVRGRGFQEAYGLDEDPAVLTWARSITREGPIDEALVGSEVIDLGEREVEVLHVPGHTLGHLALRDIVTGAVIIADAALGSAVPNADGTGAFPPTYRHVQAYLASIERLQRMSVPMLLTSHYPTYRGDEVRAFLAESTDFVHDLGRRVESALKAAAAGCTLAELVKRVNDGFGNWPLPGTAGALAFPVAGHVEDLVARGQATVSDAAGPDGQTVIKTVA